MQTNLHRVSEFFVTPKKKHDERTGIKRLLEHENDSESDTEEYFSKNTVQLALTHISARDGGSFETGICRTDPTVFLSFDWENEGPYEKAVNRLIDEGSKRLMKENEINPNEIDFTQSKEISKEEIPR